MKMDPADSMPPAFDSTAEEMAGSAAEIEFELRK
jgi:hypothetical protein